MLANVLAALEAEERAPGNHCLRRRPTFNHVVSEHGQTTVGGLSCPSAASVVCGNSYTIPLACLGTRTYTPASDELMYTITPCGRGPLVWRRNNCPQEYAGRVGVLALPVSGALLLALLRDTPARQRGCCAVGDVVDVRW